MPKPDIHPDQTRPYYGDFIRYGLASDKAILNGAVSDLNDDKSQIRVVDNPFYCNRPDHGIWINSDQVIEVQRPDPWNSFRDVLFNYFCKGHNVENLEHERSWHDDEEPRR